MEKGIYIVNEAMMQAFLDDIGIDASVIVNPDNGYTEIKTKDYTYLVTWGRYISLGLAWWACVLVAYRFSGKLLIENFEKSIWNCKRFFITLILAHGYLVCYTYRE